MIELLSEPTVPVFRGGALSALARRHRVPGAQLAIYHGGETTALNVGELEYRSGHPVTRDAAFPAGSITKAFTATVAMILVADGDLELDAPVGDHLPELKDLGNQLTLRQVLSHTGGLASGPDAEDVSASTPQRYLADHCRRRNLVLPPGTGFSYSNMGYILIGRLIETVTGMSWREATESILLRPLGIEPAFVDGSPPGPAARTVATGHSVNTLVRRTRAVRQPDAPAEAAAAGLAVSVVDLVSLGLLHLRPGMPNLLPVTDAQQMRQAVAVADPFGLADGWGLGLALFRCGTTTWVGHDGNADGTSCYLRIDPANGWIVAFTSNANVGAAMWREILVELGGAGMPIEPPRTAAPQHAPITPPVECVGMYANSDVEFAVTVRQGGRLYLTADGDASAALTFFEGLTFALRDPDSGRMVLGGRFVRDPVTGKVEGIQIGGRVARRRVPATREASRRLVA